MDPIQLTSPDGARAVLSLWGGQLLSWRPAGGAEQLYNSPMHRSGTAIRGGVPVIFPQFAAQGPGPRHGVARTRPWQLVQHEKGRDDALAVLRLEDDTETRALWPHAFALELTVRIRAAVLEMELAVENRGTAPFAFQAALHSYWRVSEVGNVVLDGLQDRRYTDAATGAQGTQHSRRLELLANRAIDRLVFGPPAPLTLTEWTETGSRALHIEPEGFDDAVVWNPGAAHGLADLPADDGQRFVCLEVGQIEEAVTLPPAAEWWARQRVTALGA